MDVIQDRELPGIAQRPMRALIVANGVLPSLEIVRTEVDCADYVLAADGGANSLQELGLTCHAVLGDFDSIAPDALNGIERIPAYDQDHTDLDKALSHVIDLGYTDVVMIGVTGGRLDHTYGALEMLVKYGRKVNLRLMDDTGCAKLAVDDITLRSRPGQLISLLPMGPVKSVTTEGLKWELKGESLASGVRDGISNVALGENISIRSVSGDLIVYLHRST